MRDPLRLSYELIDLVSEVLEYSTSKSFDQESAESETRDAEIHLCR